MRRRIPLRSLKLQAQDTMAQAQQTLQQAQSTLSRADKSVILLTQQVSQLIVAAVDAVEELMDGVSFEFTVFGRKVPFGVRLLPREETKEE